ncbi:MAG: rhodanese-like domain-containing protein [Alphaproteobacteria bacterium]
MPTTLKDMLAAANAEVPRVPPAEAKALIERGNTLVVDVRDAAELQNGGKIKGAVHVPRGMLEFRADPDSPYHNTAFAKDKTVLVYCASGGRSALSGRTLKDLGYPAVFNIGGFTELADGGVETEPG